MRLLNLKKLVQIKVFDLSGFFLDFSRKFSEFTLTSISPDDILYIVWRYTSARYNERRCIIPMEGIALTEAVFYVLLSLYSPLHGYGIMQKVESMSNGRVRLAAGTLYGAISSMVEKGWIQAVHGEKNSRRKEYVITEQGKSIAENELSRLKELISNAESVIGRS